jgi:hypothetical protein
MLYQLSYASTGKPSEIIIQAIKLQAGFQAHRKTIASRALIRSSCCLGVSHYTAIDADLVNSIL